MTTKEILIEQLKECYNETNWFVTAETALDGLTDEQSDWKAANAGWIKQESNTLAWLHDVYFINENKGWIAGFGGTILKKAEG